MFWCSTAPHCSPLRLFLADLQLCRDLTNSGADVSAVSEEGSTVLHYLAISQTTEAMEVLNLFWERHSAKLDLNAVDWDGYTPLMRWWY